MYSSQASALVYMDVSGLLNGCLVFEDWYEAQASCDDRGGTRVLAIQIRAEHVQNKHKYLSRISIACAFRLMDEA